MTNIKLFDDDKTNARPDSASTERTVEYSTEQGTVRERTAVNYKADRGNAIDNVVNTVVESKSIKNAASFLNKLVRFCLAGGGGFVVGAISYELALDKFRTYERDTWKSIWEVPESQVILGSIVIGIISAGAIYVLYSKLFIK